MVLKIVVLIIIVFVIGYFVGKNNADEKIVYQPSIEYRNDPNSVSKTTLETEVAKVRIESYDSGYAEGRRVGLNEGYESGFVQGTENGRNSILTEIDLRVQEAERTNTNLPLFRVLQ